MDQTSTPEAVAPPSETAEVEAPALEEGSADDGTDAPQKKSLKDCVHVRVPRQHDVASVLRCLLGRRIHTLVGTSYTSTRACGKG